jgi:aarF domain-containing kinase
MFSRVRFFNTHRQFSTHSQRPRKVIGITATFITLSIVEYKWDFSDKMYMLLHGMVRIVRTGIALANIVLDYKLALTPFKDKPSTAPVNLYELPEVDKEYEEALSKVNLKAANRLLELFRKNGGVYIKIGQHISALEYILPQEYCKVMTVLQNEAPKSSMEDINNVFQKEFNCSLTDIYDEFEEEPIGAASLAQVHRATIKGTSQRVAVKVQHYHLDHYASIDIATVGIAVKIIKFAFPQFEFEWLADETRKNLPKELDFVHEGQNAERIANDFQNSTRVIIPKIYWALTCKRILTMEYIDGVKITDLDYMERNGINKFKVSDTLTQIFSRMIFETGYLHCDPHAGNIFIRAKNEKPDTGKVPLSVWAPGRLFYFFFQYLFDFAHRLLSRADWEIVILDHGLYKELTSDFRNDYANLWLALITRDEENIRHYSEKLGVGEYFIMLSCMLTQRTWEGIKEGIVNPQSKFESLIVRTKAPNFLPKVAAILARVPRQLLLVLKTNDLLRSIDRTLTGNSPVHSFVVMGGYCLPLIYQDRLKKVRTITEYIDLQTFYLGNLIKLQVMNLFI